MTYDVTIYIPGKESATYRDRDQAFVDEVEAQAAEHDNWKVTISDHETQGNGRYR